MAREKAKNPTERVKNAVAAILTLGLGSALVIFLTAQPSAASVLGDPNDSKRYLREMEVYGGKANVLTAQFREGIAGMFHGRSLAGTVALLTLLLAFAVWFFAMPLPPSQGPEA